jgi:type VI secretion system protein
LDVGIKIVALPHSADALFSGSMHIPDRKFTIGRSDSNDWILTDAKRLISKRHCFIEPYKGGFRIVDESTNGTNVNGKPVDKNSGQVLRQGDEIELGQYRFRVDTGSAGRAASFGDDVPEDGSKPRITSILHDIAPRGVGADSAVEGEKHDIFAASGTAQGASAIAGFTKDLGWEAPPGERKEVVKSPHDIPRANRDLVDKFEQAPVDRLIINLPKPTVTAEPQAAQAASKPVIPDNWFEDDAPSPSAQPAAPPAPGDVRRGAIDTGKLVIIPVENADLDQADLDPSMARIYESAAALKEELADAAPDRQPASRRQTNQAAELVSSMCAGAGIHPDALKHADLEQFFYNLGRMLAVSATELHNNHVARRTAFTGLEMGAETLSQTPWIFSIGGENKDDVVRSVFAFLAEADPREIELVRRDFNDIGSFNAQVLRAALALVDRVQDAMSVSGLERHVSVTSKAIPSLRKAALWDALLQHSGLFDPSSKPNNRPDLLSLFQAELKGGRPPGA